jgi:cobyrinic acid a,c-diamide synthase
VTVACPAMLIAAPASGHGKTTVTAALAAWHRKRGRRVRTFKIGPDFLDPMILEHASGHPCYQLDLWMGGEAHCRALLHHAAKEADLVLIEGAMGLYDGRPSAADVAALFNIPVLAVLDARGMAQTFAALALGLARLRSDVKFLGTFANRVGSARHRAMLAEYLPQDLPLCGWMPREADIALPERHLGLLQAGDIAGLPARLERAAHAVQFDIELPPAVEFAAPVPAPAPADGLLLAGVRIGIARDAAFSFIYQANLDTLSALGAQLEFFSPLADAALPEVDALYLPGGYPELHLARLAQNQPMMAAIQAHHAAGKPMLAECGGMLYLLERLTGVDGETAALAGVLPGTATMQKRFVNLGLQSVHLPEGELRGHTFHYSHMETALAPFAQAVAQSETGRGDPAYRTGRLHASYMHHYFPSNPQAIARLFQP